MKVQDRTPEALGPYRLIRRLGEGGMGVVYLAADAADQPVAVKALHPGLAQEENARRRLAREVETMHRVRSRYVAEVLGGDLNCDPPYIVTRYVPGLTLDAVVNSGGPLIGQALARLATGLAEALAAVHAAGVVHRDLKPGNVMISDGEPVVIDFGIAQVPETTRLTLTGMFMGTPGYLPPEVIEGRESGAPSDVHSWGATVAFAATGRPPFGTGTFEAIFFRIMHGQPDLDTLPVPLRPLVQRALSHDPAARPSAVELAALSSGLDPALLVPSAPAVAAGGSPAGIWAMDANSRMGGEVAAGAAAGHAGLQGANGLAADGNALAGAGELANGRLGTDGQAAPVRSLLPPSSPPGALPGALPHTVADQPAWLDWPNPTRPLTAASPRDVRDLLPPVNYVPTADSPVNGGGAGAGARRSTWPAGPAVDGPAGVAIGSEAAAGRADDGMSSGAWPDGPQTRGPAEASRTVGPVSAWSPLVILLIGALVAASIRAPLIGTAFALAVIVALRGASITGRQLARRQQDSARSASSFVAVALYPIAVLRSLLFLLALAPVALLGFAVAAATTVIVVPQHPLPQALAFGAGTLVAIVGFGPGSAAPRGALAKLFSLVGDTPARLGITYAGIVALAAFAGLAAWSKPAAYWPVGNLHAQLTHLPTLRTALTDVRQNLLRLARKFGL